MSQAENLLNLFRANGNRLTLGQILGNWQAVGSKYTNRISEIRRMGFRVECEPNRDIPTENIYILKEPVQVYWREGQGEFF